MEERSIAIDGPAGAGKSTLARKTAEKFGLIYVDTGALYRCIGLSAIKEEVSPGDIGGIISLLSKIKLEMRYNDDGMQRVFLCGEDVSEDIRIPSVSTMASKVSALPPVREFLLSTQRDMAERYDVIMDGRDIGTVILPNAGLKVFLTANPVLRARRRYDELTENGEKVNFDDVLRDMEQRDKNDSARKTAPLKPAADAITLDTSEMNLEESFHALCKLINERCKA